MPNNKESKAINFKQYSESVYRIMIPGEVPLQFDITKLTFDQCLDIWSIVADCLEQQLEKERLSLIGYEQSKAKRIAMQQLYNILEKQQEELAPIVMVYLVSNPVISMCIKRETLPEIMATGLWSTTPEIITILDPEDYLMAA